MHDICEPVDFVAGPACSFLLQHPSRAKPKKCQSCELGCMAVGKANELALLTQANGRWRRPHNLVPGTLSCVSGLGLSTALRHLAGAE